MSNKQLFQDMVDELAASTNIKKKDAEEFLKSFFSTLEEGLMQDKVVKINGLGTFKLIEVEARTSVDVNTGKSFIIKEHYKLSFTPDAQLKDAVNKPFANFESVEADCPGDSETEVVDSKPNETKTSQPEIQSKPEPETESEADSQSELEPEPPRRYTKNYVKGSPQTIGGSSDYSRHANGGEEPKVSKRLPWFFIIVLALLVAVVALWTYKSNYDAKRERQHKIEFFQQFKGDSASNVIKQPVRDDKQLEDSIMAAIEADIAADSMARLEQDRLVEEALAVTEPKVVPQATPVKPTVQPTVKPTVKPTTTSPKADTFRVGDRLTLMAEKHYGHKVFWVYLYIYNKDHISDPNDIPVGTIINIPAQDMSRMNPKDPTCLKKALELQEKILSE